MRKSLFVLCLLVCLMWSQSAFADKPFAILSKDLAIIKNGDHRLAAVLSDGSLTLSTPYGTHRLKVNIALDGKWITPSPSTGFPLVKNTKDSVTVIVTYPVKANRQFIISLSAYKNVPGVFAVTKLKVLGADRQEYYFWEWEDKAQSYYCPSSHGPQMKSISTKDWTRFGYQPWVMFPDGDHGLAVMTNGTVGHSTLDMKTAFLHALPRQRVIGSGESIDVGFGFAGVKDASQASAVWSAANKAGVTALKPVRITTRRVDYGKPAPSWLRNSELYNGFYQPATDWTDQAVNEKLKYFRMVVGNPDKDGIARCHRAGIKVIAYVAFTPFLNTELQVREGGRVYDEWLRDPEHDSRDLKDHPDWCCYNADGKLTRDAWGMANGNPGQIATCMHQPALQNAGVRLTKLLMDMGYDGIFVDLAWPTYECYGDKFGKHKHVPGKTNNDMYQQLLRKVYKQVKSFGEDKIVIHNSNIMPAQWSYCDAQMWEACIAGNGTSEKMNEWVELKALGESYSEAVKKGKLPIILSYFDAQPQEVVRDRALYTYAYSHFYGFLWADWFTLLAKNQELAKQLYSTRLGTPVGNVTQSGICYYRVFKNGVAIINPSNESTQVKIQLKQSGELADVGYGRSIVPVNGSVSIEMTPDSGRILVFSANNRAIK